MGSYARAATGRIAKLMGRGTRSNNGDFDLDDQHRDGRPSTLLNINCLNQFFFQIFVTRTNNQYLKLKQLCTL
uniref:Uncharacterized protein n=1 Tax=Caenorhabditis japonica TaxID=281687 RepID=A0A8R1EHJ8_CAEJA